MTATFLAPPLRLAPTSGPSLKRIMLALRRSLCLVRRDSDLADTCVHLQMDIGQPFNVKHVAHVTFDRFRGFLGLPDEFLSDVNAVAPSASLSVFGVRPESMQCSIDARGNTVPTILLRLQDRLYRLAGLRAEGIFRVSAELDSDAAQSIRDQLSAGDIPPAMDAHALALLIKTWFRELPTGLLDSLSPQAVAAVAGDECAAVALAATLPATQRGLLDWVLNLMADVAEHEAQNKMSSRSVALVFAPNMTQVIDPIIGLQHAVRVIDFLRLLVDRCMRMRADCAVPTGAVTSAATTTTAAAAAATSTTTAATTTTAAATISTAAPAIIESATTATATATAASRGAEDDEAASEELREVDDLRLQQAPTQQTACLATAPGAAAEHASVNQRVRPVAAAVEGQSSDKQRDVAATADAVAVAAAEGCAFDSCTCAGAAASPGAAVPSLKRPTGEWLEESTASMISSYLGRGGRQGTEAGEVVSGHMHKRTRSSCTGGCEAGN